MMEWARKMHRKALIRVRRRLVAKLTLNALAAQGDSTEEVLRKFSFVEKMKSHDQFCCCWPKSDWDLDTVNRATMFNKRNPSQWDGSAMPGPCTLAWRFLNVESRDDVGRRLVRQVGLRHCLLSFAGPIISQKSNCSFLIFRVGKESFFCCSFRSSATTNRKVVNFHPISRNCYATNFNVTNIQLWENYLRQITFFCVLIFEKLQKSYFTFFWQP